MSVKPVIEIPKPSVYKQKSFRQMIREDISYAIEHNILKFEFEGEYNYDSLPNAAKQVADEMYIKAIRKMNVPYISQRFTPYIRISSVKGEKHKRVFCEISPQNLERLVSEAKKEEER